MTDKVLGVTTATGHGLQARGNSNIHVEPPLLLIPTLA